MSRGVRILYELQFGDTAVAKLLGITWRCPLQGANHWSLCIICIGEQTFQWEANRCYWSETHCFVRNHRNHSRNLWLQSSVLCAFLFGAAVHAWIVCRFYSNRYYSDGC